jgi:hypothetical protein
MCHQSRHQLDRRGFRRLVFCLFEHGTLEVAYKWLTVQVLGGGLTRELDGMARGAGIEPEDLGLPAKNKSDAETGNTIGEGVMRLSGTHPHQSTRRAASAKDSGP